jgi:hypothetical protein
MLAHSPARPDTAEQLRFVTDDDADGGDVLGAVARLFVADLLAGNIPLTGAHEESANGH